MLSDGKQITVLSDEPVSYMTLGSSGGFDIVFGKCKANANSEAILASLNHMENLSLRSIPVVPVPKHFDSQPKEEKVRIVMKWMLKDSDDTVANILSGGHGKINNIIDHLTKMEHKGYLRVIQNLDIKLLEPYCTDTSFCMLTDFVAEHKDEENVCCSCGLDLGAQYHSWRCQQCLQWHHKDCSTPNMYGQNTTLYCTICLYSPKEI